MPALQYFPGDLVWSGSALFNDGGIPEIEERALVAPAGARGVVVQAGSVENRPEIRVYLVRFEGPDGVLGPPVGCLTEEITQEIPAGHAPTLVNPGG